MKTAVSIPDLLFESAENFARRRGLSRSELYATALQRYLQEHQGEAITRQLDSIYDTESSTLEPEVADLQSRSLTRDTW